MKCIEITNNFRKVLIPVNKIKYVVINYDKGSWLIVITLSAAHYFSENFPDEKSARKRYEQIVKLIEAA